MDYPTGGIPIKGINSLERCVVGFCVQVDGEAELLNSQQGPHRHVEVYRPETYFSFFKSVLNKSFSQACH